MPANWLSTDEAAKLLGLPPATICTYAARGTLRRRRIGRTVQVSAASVRAYQAGRKGQGRPAGTSGRGESTPWVDEYVTYLTGPANRNDGTHAGIGLSAEDAIAASRYRCDQLPRVKTVHLVNAPRWAIDQARKAARTDRAN
jgi:excisionase family DNA binding protein